MTVTYGLEILRGGVKYTDAETTGWTVTMDAGAEIKLSLRAFVAPDDNIDWISDRLRPYVVIDGVKTPLGVFTAGTVTQTADDGGVKTTEIEAYDFSLIVKQTRAETRPHFASGARYADVISSLLGTAGISKSAMSASSATLQTPREDWDIGTDYLTIINALLAEINFNDLWFDRDGIAQIGPIVSPKAANIVRTYRADETSVISDAATISLDIYDKPNVFIGVVENADYDTVMTATSINDNPLSALSVSRRGRRIAQVTKLDNIAGQSALQTYMDNLRDKSFLSTETVTYKTAINPEHAYMDVIALNHPALDGIYQETGWSITPGQLMTHTARRLLLI